MIQPKWSLAAAEFLNNLRWSIYRYLRPEYRRAWHLTEHATPDLALYAYDIPADIAQPVARAMYWELMNRVRARPWVQQFTITDSLKRRY